MKKRLKKQVKKKLWLTGQWLALLCVLTSPLWFQKHGASRDRSPASALSFKTFSGDESPTISSSVFVLPNPKLQDMAVIEQRVSSKQVRLEWAIAPQRKISKTKMRDIASAKKSALFDKAYQLQSLKRRDAATKKWKDLPLIYGENQLPIGSSYLELSSDTTEFLVSYWNTDGQIQSYELKLHSQTR